MKDAKEEKYVWEDERWADTIFACLEKIQELLKQKPFTTETAEQIEILAKTALYLESPTIQNQPAQF